MEFLGPGFCRTCSLPAFSWPRTASLTRPSVMTVPSDATISKWFLGRKRWSFSMCGMISCRSILGATCQYGRKTTCVNSPSNRGDLRSYSVSTVTVMAVTLPLSSVPRSRNSGRLITMGGCVNVCDTQRQRSRASRIWRTRLPKDMFSSAIVRASSRPSGGSPCLAW